MLNTQRKLLPASPLPESKPENITLIKAKSMYSNWVSAQGFHFNRFLSFDELPQEDRASWLNKAYNAANPPQLALIEKTKTAWPTNDEVYSELVRRKTPGSVMFLSLNAVNHVMAAVNHLSCADMQKDVFVAGMQATVDGLIKERDALRLELDLVCEERDALLKRPMYTGHIIRTDDPMPKISDFNLEIICDTYESGVGHGTKKDGLDASRTPHANPTLSKAYQIGYEAGEERAPKEETNPLRSDLPSLLDWELACDITIKGENIRRIVTIGELLKLMEGPDNVVLHHTDVKTGVRSADIETELVLPNGWALIHTGTANLISAISAAVISNESQVAKETRISVSKFLKHLNYTQGPVKILLKKDANGSLELENGNKGIGKSKYAVRCN